MCVPRAKGRPQKSATSRRQQAAQGRSTSSQTQEIAHAQSQAESFPRTAIIDLSTWSVQNTCFGEILRGPCGTLFVLPTGLLEEVAHNFKQLSQRKDLTLFVNANYKSSLLMREYLINSLLFISRV